jgi:serine/threonine protein kinase
MTIDDLLYLHNYLLLQLKGEGKYGRVYLAKHISTQTRVCDVLMKLLYFTVPCPAFANFFLLKVAIKVLMRPDECCAILWKAKVQKEVEIMRKLNSHRNIVQLIEVIESTDVICLVR